MSLHFLNCIRPEHGGNFLAVCEDGSYPLENLDSIWKRLAPITRDAAFELLGMPKDKANHNTLTNKCFCIYGIDYDAAYAVYTHDGNWYILRADIGKFEVLTQKTRRRHPLSRGSRGSTQCTNHCCTTYAKPALIEKE